MMCGGPTLSGLGTMTRFILRRNRWFLSIWIVMLAPMPPMTVAKYTEILPPEQRTPAALNLLATNPTMRFLLGLPFDLSSAGGFTAWRIGTFLAGAAAMMCALFVIRNTRAEEENGHQELLRAGIVGRHAPLAATLLSVAFAMAVTGLLLTSGLIGAGANGLGAWVYGAGIALVGLMFAGVGAVCAQIFSSARTARYWAVGIVLGGLYALRGVIDASGDSLATPLVAWFMPLDWFQLARPYADERPWVLLLPLAVSAVLFTLAFWMAAHRDHGAGLRQTALGRADAPASLSGAYGLAWRLQRSTLIGWFVGVVLFALTVGAMAESITSFFDGNASTAQMLHKMGSNTASLADAFYAAMSNILTPLIALASILVLNRTRAEEQHGHAETILSTTTSRTSFLLSHLCLALLISVGLTMIAIPALGVLPMLDGHPTRLLWTLTQAAFFLLPGNLVLIGLATFLHGWVPTLSSAMWALVGWSIFDTWLLPAMWPQIPDWLARLTPWGWLPHVPGDPVRWLGWSVTVVIATALLGLGYVGYRRRDITSDS